MPSASMHMDMVLAAMRSISVCHTQEPTCEHACKCTLLAITSTTHERRTAARAGPRARLALDVAQLLDVDAVVHDMGMKTACECTHRPLDRAPMASYGCPGVRRLPLCSPLSPVPPYSVMPAHACCHVIKRCVSECTDVVASSNGHQHPCNSQSAVRTTQSELHLDLSCPETRRINTLTRNSVTQTHPARVTMASAR